MEFQKLNATSRNVKGKNAARAIRRGGNLPAVLYGPGCEPLMLTIDGKELDLALQNCSAGLALFTLNIDGAEKSQRNVMLKELQVHPLSRAALHVDLLEVASDRKIRAMVPISVVGTSKGVEYGGMLQIVRREVEVLCLPMLIPSMIEIDITNLDIGDSVHANDITMEADVDLALDTNFTILTVLSPTKAEEEEEAVGEDELEEGETGESESEDDDSPGEE